MVYSGIPSYGHMVTKMNTYNCAIKARPSDQLNLPCKEVIRKAGWGSGCWYSGLQFTWITGAKEKPKSHSPSTNHYTTSLSTL